MTVSFDQLSDLLLRQRLSENPPPLLRRLNRVHFPLGRGGCSGPFAGEPARTEGGELGGFSEADGLDVGIGLGIRVPEVEGEVGAERFGRSFDRTRISRILPLLLVGFLLVVGLSGFGDWRERRVVVVGGGGAVVA